MCFLARGGLQRGADLSEGFRMGLWLQGGSTQRAWLGLLCSQLCWKPGTQGCFSGVRPCATRVHRAGDR